MIFLLTALCLLPPLDHPVQQQKNVLILLMDDIGVDSVGVYEQGTDLPSTPTIAQLAAVGVRFTNVWSNPVCSPTRATILTGLYSDRTGIGYTVVDGTPGLPLGTTTIPEMLEMGGAGYTTAAFGKWHLGNDQVGGSMAPNLAGFQHYAGALVNLHPPETYFDWIKTVDGVDQATSGYITTDMVDDAVEWIRNAPEPWFCYVAFHSAHTPYHAPPPSLHSVNLEKAGPPSEDPRPYFKAMVESMDTEIGRLLFQASIDIQQTTILCLGDNGTDQTVIQPPFDPTHGKGTAYQGGIRVPLIAVGPNVLQPGSLCHALVNTTDLFATVAELAGVDLSLPAFDPIADWGGPGEVWTSGENTLAQPTSVSDPPLPGGPEPLEPPTFLGPDSISLAPYMAHPERQSLRSFAYAELFQPNGIGLPLTEVRRTVRSQKYKLISRTIPPAAPEVLLFDLDADPLELNDLLLGDLTAEQQQAFLELRQLQIDVLVP
jgi:arylsulfatase A-like enzyme